MKNQSKNIWFISDLHFGHGKVIEYSNRPFKSVDEMDEALIKRWNSVVRPEDTVIVVGDFFMYHKKAKLKEILSRLNGKKILVRGNHDMTAPEMLTIGFDHVCESMTMKIANEIVNVSHYPYARPWWWIAFYRFMHKLLPAKFFNPRVFKNQLKPDGRFLIHGHTHSIYQATPKKKMIHVGVDAWDYKPVSIQKIGNMISEIRSGHYSEPFKPNNTGHHE
jgi:calcineurin-like phosphoesterase family protein